MSIPVIGICETEITLEVIIMRKVSINIAESTYEK
jgi:Asp/Glu/hydantoin racemase